MRSPFGALLNRATRPPDVPVPYVGRGGAGLPWVRSGSADAQMRAMSAVGTLFAIVDRTANATALVEWKLYRKARSGKKEDRTEVTSHAALDLWNRPNPFMPRQEYVETFQQHHDLTGEAWWVIARVKGIKLPLELWPVRPDRMIPVPSRERFLAGYIYAGPDGEQIPLGLDEVIQIRRPNPHDPYRGLSPVLSVLPDLDTSRYAAEWSRSFFMNSAEPGGIIEVPNGLSDPEFDQLRDRWNEQHRGVANAHRVAILEHGQWKDRKLTQRDMQFVELRGATRDAIREAYGISKTAIGDFEDINRATALAAKAWFAEQITIPRLERIKAALNFELLPMFGATAEGLEFDYCDPVPPDAEAQNAELLAKAQALKLYVEAGFEPESAREALGLPEMEVVALAPPGAGPDVVDGAISPQALAGVVQALCLSVAPDGLRSARVPPPLSAGSGVLALTAASEGSGGGADADLEQMRKDHHAALEPLLAHWGPIEDAWIGDLADQVEAAVDDADPAALSALAVGADEAAGVLRGALAAAAQQAAERMAAEARRQGVDVDAPEVDEALTNRLQPGRFVNFGGELADIAQAVAALLGSGMAAAAGQEALRRYTPGAAGRTVANAVKGFLRGLKGVFRRDQLGGALHRAQNTGRLATLEAAPVARYEASEYNDLNTCSRCSEIDGTVFPDLAAAVAAYGTGGYVECEGGIRCRGTVTATWDK